MKRVVLFILISGTAAAIGFGLAFDVIGVWNAIRGPFQREWDDTWRQAVPVGLAYLIWGAAIVAGLIIAWRVTDRTENQK